MRYDNSVSTVTGYGSIVNKVSAPILIRTLATEPAATHSINWAIPII